MSQSEPDRHAAAAVVAHHTQLAADLARHAALLRDDATVAEEVGAGQAPGPQWRDDRAALVGWLREELLPHAAAEEGTLYPAAAAQPGGRLLVDGMLGEHQAIMALVRELDGAGTAAGATAAARALSAVFEVHLAKENDLVLPLLLAAEEVSLAGLLAGMHDLLGAAEASGTETPATEASGTESGCGCGGSGCGGEEGRAGAPAPVLTVDTRLDVRHLPHDQRHAQVLDALAALPADGALVLVAPHVPRPLLAEIDARYPGQIAAEWLQEGPDVWQIRLHRQLADA
jgi:uncharacterized protein (DUF2249 family)